MKKLQNKHIVLAITGGIAAYKSADLVRRLQDAGASVRVVMTEAATGFVTPLTFQALAGQPVLVDENTSAANGMAHIELARWADLVLVAPATADFIARLIHGRADDLVAALCLATSAPVAVAPAMNQQMWENPATQANIRLLDQRGIHRFGPAQGSQACGETGFGRMLEPLDLVEQCATLFDTGLLQGVSVLITAGPTQEPIDPVRVITNLSSGKMGYAVAQAALDAGASVTLVSGPTCLTQPERAKVIPVQTAQQMYDAVHEKLDNTDIFIGVAAVSDYRVAQPADAKIKKDADELSLVLVKNPDILAGVAASDPRPFCVGFAAETDHLEGYAREKLEQKRLDMIAANMVGNGQGIGADDNALLLLTPRSKVELTRAAKSQLARQFIEHVAKHYLEQKNSA
ncbi:MAG: bifunctional phosphopantothenoylcysteine decarboxylase/phosphopantothenate--cysteine ligase CoaBC [Gammaproteobacteria bacterium]|nr:MAG: bifunctional phosphopantothenoylcysteine decarboxylase/phosphopantothenate--cysteine ligase CoaBC [Gammaproteobacteria bacterium]